MTDNELRDLLEQNQRTISETTGLLKRPHELSVAIAESHQEQIRELKLARLELKDAHLAFAVETKQAFLRLIESQAKADTRMDRVEARWIGSKRCSRDSCAASGAMAIRRRPDKQDRGDVVRSSKTR